MSGFDKDPTDPDAKPRFKRESDLPPEKLAELPPVHRRLIQLKKWLRKAWAENEKRLHTLELKMTLVLWVLALTATAAVTALLRR